MGRDSHRRVCVPRSERINGICRFLCSRVFNASTTLPFKPMQSQVGRKGKLNHKWDKQQIGDNVLLTDTSHACRARGVCVHDSTGKWGPSCATPACICPHFDGIKRRPKRQVCVCVNVCVCVCLWKHEFLNDKRPPELFFNLEDCRRDKVTPFVNDFEEQQQQDLPGKLLQKQWSHFPKNKK